jgi:hypothetical protein
MKMAVVIVIYYLSESGLIIGVAFVEGCFKTGRIT